MNILITSGSRKVWLVKAFKDALKSLGMKGKVMTVDKDPLSASLYKSDGGFVVPASTSPGFLRAIMDICEKKKIGLLVPARDGELMLFAENKALFQKRGVLVAVSDKEVIEKSGDKYAFHAFLSGIGLKTPRTGLLSDRARADIGFPMMLKPRYGSGSRGVRMLMGPADLSRVSTDPGGWILQEYIAGREFTVDVFSDIGRNVISVIPRERIEVVSGESYKARTVKSDDISSAAIRLVKKIRSFGQVTIQCIRNDSGVYFIDMNPRPGGGSALSIKAGGDYPRFLIEQASGKRTVPILGNYEIGLVMLRYSEDIIIKEGDVLPECP
ncbi:MAG: ATP-grasp domain-containing protein [Candidatus Omnitrophica bacterium]|nr:ATP-grasp domain-containing protein [Candidatus Omnitrophota bacterium]